MSANYDAKHADAFFADLWELLGEVPVDQILRKIHREWPDIGRRRLLLETMRRVVSEAKSGPNVQNRATALREVAAALESQLS